MFGCHVALKQELFSSLALESLLLGSSAPPPPLLCLWQGPRAVVLGKNQNPWKECNLAVLRERGLLLGRRVSGGGAVYHDPGNLNVSWVFDRKQYDPSLPPRLLARVLARFGARAEPAAHGGLRINGNKVSGAAYCYRQDRVLHHGTLLVDANLADLRAALSPPRVRVDTHAVASVPAQVANLTLHRPGVTLEEVALEIESAARAALGDPRPFGLTDFEPGALEAESDRMASPEWIWGQTPAFSATVRVNELEACFSVRRGRVLEVRDLASGETLSVDVPFGMSFARWWSARESVPAERVLQAFAAAGLDVRSYENNSSCRRGGETGSMSSGPSLATRLTAGETG